MNKFVSMSVGAILIVASFSMIVAILHDTDSPKQIQEGDSQELYVFALAGQSQAAYRAYDVTIANELPGVEDGKAWYYGTSAHPVYYNASWPTWDYSEYDLNSMTNPDGTWRVGSIESAFASKWVNSTNTSILIINTAISGRTISSFVEGSEGWDYSTKILDDALAKIPQNYTIHMGGIIWLHGQANLTASKEWYVKEFGKVYDQYREYGFNKCVIEQPRASEAPTIDVANEIICKTYPGCYIGSTFGTNHIVNGGPYLYDHTHYNQKGRNIVGMELATCYTDVVYRDLAWSSPTGSGYALLWVIPALVIIVGVVEIARLMYRTRV